MKGVYETDVKLKNFERKVQCLMYRKIFFIEFYQSGKFIKVSNSIVKLKKKKKKSK